MIRISRDKPLVDGCRGPVAPGSTLHQLLQMIARAVAQELVNTPEQAKRAKAKRKPSEPP